MPYNGASALERTPMRIVLVDKKGKEIFTTKKIHDERQEMLHQSHLLHHAYRMGLAMGRNQS